MTYGAGFRIFAVLPAFPALLMGVLFFFTEYPDARPIILAIFMFFAAMSALLVLICFGTSFELRADCIVINSPWLRSRSIPLTDLRSVSYSISKQRYEIQTQEHGVIQLYIYLSGLPQFWEALYKKTGIVRPE